MFVTFLQKMQRINPVGFPLSISLIVTILREICRCREVVFRRLFSRFGRVNRLVCIFFLEMVIFQTYLYLENIKSCFCISSETRFRSCLEFIPAFYKECFRGFLFVLMRSIAGYVTNKNGEKDRKQI